MDCIMYYCVPPGSLCCVPVWMFSPPLILQEMSVGYANGIRVMSITHTGEPGFMLYIPIEVRVRGSLSSLKQLLACIIRNSFHADSGSRSVSFIPAEFPCSAWCSSWPDLVRQRLGTVTSVVMCQMLSLLPGVCLQLCVSPSLCSMPSTCTTR